LHNHFQAEFCKRRDDRGHEGNAVLANRADEPGSATVDVMAFNDAMMAIDAIK